MDTPHPLSYIMDCALDYGCTNNLNTTQICNVIKALAQNAFGARANDYLVIYGMCITDEDTEGIEQANKLINDAFQDFYGHQQI